MKSLLKLFFNRESHYSAVLPYNLAWKLKPGAIRSLGSFLDKHPLTVYDIGARGGDLGEISNLQKHLRYIAFDADKEEAALLQQQQATKFHELQVYPYFIGSDKKLADFHIYKEPGQSSIFKPAKRFKSLFAGDGFDTAKTVPVRCVTLDTLVRDEKVHPPDLLKIDTQGSELSILKSAQKTLKQTLLIEVECEFIEMYKGQPLFHDICKFLYGIGFELLYVNRVFANRSAYNNESRGQITFCDALFGRREDRLQGFAKERIAKYAILLANYGHIDFSHHLWGQFPEIQALVPGLQDIVRLKQPSRFPRIFRRLSRLVLDTFNKILLLLLYLRRSNGLPMDSDRSWPIR